MSDARTMKNIASFFGICLYMETAEAKLAPVCPDGNEASCAGPTIQLSPSTSSYGLTLPTRFFSIRLLTISDRIKPHAEYIPAFLVCLKHRSTMVSRIQKIPASPRCVMLLKKRHTKYSLYAPE